MYLPSAGVAAILLISLWNLLPARKRLPLFLALSGVAAGGLGIATHARNRIYQSRESIWQACVTKIPGNYRAHHNLNYAKLLWHQQRRDAAERYRDRAPELEPSLEKEWEHALASSPGSGPGSGKAPQGFAEQRLVKARELARQGRIDAAMTLVDAVPSDDRRLAAAWIVRGNVARLGGRAEVAATSYQTALELEPDSPTALNSLGGLLAKTKPAQAIALFRRALELDPQLAEAHNNLANALARSGDLSGAVKHYRLALAADPQLTAAQRNLTIVERMLRGR